MLVHLEVGRAVLAPLGRPPDVVFGGGLADDALVLGRTARLGARERRERPGGHHVRARLVLQGFLVELGRRQVVVDDRGLESRVRHRAEEADAGRGHRADEGPAAAGGAAVALDDAGAGAGVV